MEIMKKILSDDYPHVDLDSSIIDVGDSIDSVNFIIRLEEEYGFQIFDNEAEYISNSKITLRDVHYFMMFLKNGEIHPPINGLLGKLSANLKDTRPEYEDLLIKIRSEKIDMIFKDGKRD